MKRYSIFDKARKYPKSDEQLRYHLRLLDAKVVERAQNLATKAHTGQTDKAGRPYIEHVSTVAAYVGSIGLVAAVAWLHDVVEDTDVDMVNLVAQEFPAEVVKAVDAITRRPAESPESYYRRVKNNDLARVVKWADIRHNSEPDRLAKLDEETRGRLTKKYMKAQELLLQLEVHVHLKDGRIINIPYDSNENSPIDVLQRAYRDDDLFMIYEVEKVTFSGGYL